MQFQVQSRRSGPTGSGVCTVDLLRPDFIGFAILRNMRLDRLQSLDHQDLIPIGRIDFQFDILTSDTA